MKQIILLFLFFSSSGFAQTTDIVPSELKGLYKVVGGRGSICIPGELKVIAGKDETLVKMTERYLFTLRTDGSADKLDYDDASVGPDICPMSVVTDRGDGSDKTMKIRSITSYKCPWGDIVQTTTLHALGKMQIEVRDHLVSTNQDKKRNANLVCRWRRE